jgi:2-oxoglutarate ferredoxin oxidoreductase subunit gamma
MDPNTVAVYGPTVRPGGLLVVNSSLAPESSPRTDISIVTVPTNEIAEAIGDIRYAGMVGLGALIGGTGVVGLDAVRACLESTLPSYRHHMIPANVMALSRGAECAGRPAPLS